MSVTMTRMMIMLVRIMMTMLKKFIVFYSELANIMTSVIMPRISMTMMKKVMMIMIMMVTSTEQEIIRVAPRPTPITSLSTITVGGSENYHDDHHDDDCDDVVVVVVAIV